MNNKLCWLPRYWIELFRSRKDPNMTVFISDGRVKRAMKLAAKHEGAKSVRKVSSNYLWDSYSIKFRSC
jgi:hypothetical protein